MSDNLKIRRPLDAKRINMNQAHEMAYWTRTLGISELYLRIVVPPTSFIFYFVIATQKLHSAY